MLSAEFAQLTLILEHRLDNIRGLIVSGIKPLVVTETNLKVPSLICKLRVQVKKELSHIVIAMASHDYLSLEGGETFVEFIVRNSSTSEAEIDRYNKEKVYQLHSLAYSVGQRKRKK